MCIKVSNLNILVKYPPPTSLNNVNLPKVLYSHFNIDRVNAIKIIICLVGNMQSKPQLQLSDNQKQLKIELSENEQ